MLHEIGGEVDLADVVAIDEGGTLERTVELLEQLAQPGGLCHAVGHNAILGLCAGAGDEGLQLGDSGDEVGTQEHDISGSGLACVGTSSPISVGVDHKVRRRGGSE
jgi:hypothetical protein